MKTKLNIILLAFSSWLCFSCSDFLEEPSDVAGKTDKVVFSTIEEAEKVLASANAMQPYGFPFINGAAGAWCYNILNYFATIPDLCDEAETQNRAQEFIHTYYHMGSLAANTIFPFREDKWDFEWFAIRNAWMFYEKVDQVNDGTPKSYINRRKAEALGIIAVKYFELFKRYGGLPWINHYVQSGETPAYARLSVTATVDSIASLIDRAIAVEDFPVRNSVDEFGRLNKMTMYGLKANLLLFSASPLFNPEDNVSYYPSFTHQEVIKHDEYRKERWKEAADAALEAINVARNNGFELYTKSGDPKVDYKAAVTVFPGNVVSGVTTKPTFNPEIIWGTRTADSYAGSAVFLYMYSRNKLNANSGGVTTCIPLQNFVDLYEMKDGNDQPADVYSKKNPYDDFEPRFHVTIAYHGRVLGVNQAKHTVDVSEPSGDNYIGGAGNNTGYYFTKFFDEDFLTGRGNCPQGFWPYMRLAEIYLDYVEALCEYNYGANKVEIFKYLNLIRNRAGLPNLQEKKGFVDSYDYVRKAIRHERAIELAYENQRYFDLKRWKDVEKTIGGPMYAMHVKGTAENPVFSKELLETRIWGAKWYLFPLKDDDVKRTNGVMCQNPGW